MNKITSLLLLLIFSVYSFTFKTHYCYHPDGSRFHGDCTEHLHTSNNSNKSTTSVNEQKYNCVNIQLEKQYPQDYSIKSVNDFWFILPEIAELPFVVSPSQAHTIPLFSCRGGPPLISDSPLRGPPAC